MENFTQMKMLLNAVILKMPTLLNLIGKRAIAAMSLCVLTLLSSFATAQDLPGATQTSYGVSQSGAFQYQIPIVIPQGTNGIQPNISLSFSSDRRNGPLGVGWGIAGLSSITRCGKTFATNGIKGGVLHDTNDRYCLDGRQLKVISGGYGANNSEYRTEIDSFSKIVSQGSSTNQNGGTAPATWEVKRKNGLIYTYGNGSTQYTLPGTSSVHAWRLDKVEDRSGNSYSVSYTSAGLPDLITYAGSTNLKVDFQWGTRPDVRTRYIAGKKITDNQRLTQILVQKGSTQLRKYDIAYQSSPTSKKSRVTSVQECGLGGECMPSIPIQWRSENNGFGYSTADPDTAPDHLIEHYSYNAVLGYDSSGTDIVKPRVKEINRGTWADVNGDGEADLIVAYKNPAGTFIKKAYIKQSNGTWQETSSWRLPKPLRSYQNDIVNDARGRFKSPVVNQGQMIDVNGDGLVDVVYSYRVDKHAHQHKVSHEHVELEQLRETYLNTGSGWQLSTSYQAKDYIFDYVFVHANGLGTDTHGAPKGQFVDLNGDGLVDWISSVRLSNSSRNTTSGSLNKTWINDGSKWVENTTFAPPTYLHERLGSHIWQRAELVDVNGDGLPDWVEAYKSPWEGNVYNTWLNTGTQFTPAASSFNLNEAIFDHPSTGPTKHRGSFVDVNGDGLRDFVRSYRSSTTSETRATKLNTGKGWATDSNYQAPFIHQDYTYSGKTGSSGTEVNGASWPVMTTGYYIDANRDGLVDFVQGYKDMDTARTVRKHTWLNTGTGWDQQDSIHPGWKFFDYSDRQDAKPTWGSFVDINADGSLDWVENLATSGLNSRPNNLDKIDLISKITTTSGVEVKPTFLPLTDNDTLYTREPNNIVTGVPINQQADSFFLEAPICVVSELKVSRPDESGDNTTQYHYGGAQVHRKGRGYLGFYERTVTNVQTGLKTQQAFKQKFPFTGMVIESQTIEASTGNWISKTNNTYLEQSLNSGKTTFPYRSKSTSETAELNANGGSNFSWTEQTINYVTSGNGANFGNIDTVQTKSGSSAAAADLLQTTLGG